MTARRGPTLRRVLLATLALGAAGLVTTTPAVAATGGPTLVSGTVTGVDGSPLQNVTVTAVIIKGVTYKPATTTTGRDGRYQLSVPDIGVTGRYGHVQFGAAEAVGGTSATGYADRCYQGSPVCLQTDRAFAYDGTARVVDVALARANLVPGRVTDSLGRGIGGLQVLARPQDGLPPNTGGDRYATTDRNGNYVLPRLNPYTYDLTYGDPTVWTTPATPARDGYVFDTAQVTLAGGRTVTRNITLAGGGAITGVVVDPAGVPVADASVAYYPGLTPGSRQAAAGAPAVLREVTTTTAADGTYTLHDLPRAQGRCARRRGR